ncbi:hypothetical protein [Alcaligenes sp. SDU_A2]|uniref:hypothetical protein n=1 Tax=Alcaligenes sp. SDU_A2 TaxID=3136634 RepID=UPI00311F2C7A
MGLRDELMADIAEAFDTDLADAVTEFKGRRIERGLAYDPVNEVWPEVEIIYSGRGVIGGYKLELIDGIRILATDSKLTALQGDVDGTPKVGDKINGMEVLNVGQDPVGATWTLQLRRV